MHVRLTTTMENLVPDRTAKKVNSEHSTINKIATTFERHNSTITKRKIKISVLLKKLFYSRWKNTKERYRMTNIDREIAI